jgi:quercetin dioxygenase-like cupin family protein
VSDGYEVANIDELEELPVQGGEFVWRPIRRRFGITAFGTNAYTARAGQRVVEEHFEKEGHQEMYVVLRGRATFALGDDEVDAPAGTIVFVRPGTKRGAIAAEDDTAVLAVGAQPGIVFEPSPWEDIFAANSYADLGDLGRARKLVAEALAQHPDAWQGFFNAACLEARVGDRERALDYFERSAALEPEKTREFAKTDSDFDSIRNEPRFLSAVSGEADSAA